MLYIWRWAGWLERVKWCDKVRRRYDRDCCASIFRTPSIGVRHVSSSFLMSVNFVPDWSSLLAALRKNSFVDWAGINVGTTGGLASVLSESVTKCISKLKYAFYANILVVASSTFLSLAITKTRSSYSSNLLSVPSVGSRDKASAAWWLTPARCMTSMSSFNRRSHYRASLQVASAKFNMQQS